MGTLLRRYDSDGDSGIRGYSDDQSQTHECAASSMQQTQGFPVASLKPLQPADCWSKVYILHSRHAATCINELPASPWSGCGLQCTQISRAQAYTLELPSWAQGGGRGWMLLFWGGDVVKFKLAKGSCWWCRGEGGRIRVATHPGFPKMSRICTMLSRIPARPAPGCQMSRNSRCSQNDNDNNNNSNNRHDSSDLM